MIVPAKNKVYILMKHVAPHVSVCVSLSNTGEFQEFSAKARESGFQTRGCRERKNPHRERLAKETAKEKSESNRTNRWGFGNSSNDDT